MCAKRKAVKKTTKAKAETNTKKAEGVEEIDFSAFEEPENTNLDTLYILEDSDNKVFLEINVGAAGQTSDMTIRLDNALVVKEHPGDFPRTSLGTNKSLNGKKLGIVATIADTARDTNFTSLTIRLSGGLAPADFPLSKTVDAEGQSADYLCLIEFFKP